MTTRKHQPGLSSAEHTHSSLKVRTLVRWWRVFVHGSSFLHHCCQVEPSLCVLRRSQPRALLRFSWRL